MIHFRIRDDTLCGADYTEPNKKAAKNGRLCNECIQVIWQEQYRRNVLSKYKASVSDTPEPTDMTVRNEHDSHSPALYLCDFGNEVLTI